MPSQSASLSAADRATSHFPGSRVLIAVAALVSLSACAGRPTPAGAPAPYDFPVREPGLLGEPTEFFEVEVTAPKRDILGTAAYDLPVEANSWVEAELDFLVNERSAVIGRWIERGDLYQGFIKQELQTAGVPTDLYHLALIESGALPTVRSRAGAVGFWQFMPATARQSGLRVDDAVDERMDPVRSTRAAARHLRHLHRSFGDWALAAAAYNAGSGRISRGLQKFGATDFWTLAERGDLAEETKRYVPRLYAMTVIGRDRTRFGFAPPPIVPDFAYDSIQVEYATPLDELTKISRVSRDQLERLNPHLVRGITPEGGYWVWIPAGEGIAMQRAYLASDFRKFRGLGTYAVRAGDNLGKLSDLSGLSMSKIRELNPKVRFDPLQIGEELKLPFQVARELASRGETRVAAAEEKPAKEEGSGAKTEKRAQRAAEADDGDVGAETHTVTTGETLWEIARRYDVAVERLQAANAPLRLDHPPRADAPNPVSRRGRGRAGAGDGGAPGGGRGDSLGNRPEVPLLGGGHPGGQRAGRPSPSGRGRS